MLNYYLFLNLIATEIVRRSKRNQHTTKQRYPLASVFLPEPLTSRIHRPNRLNLSLLLLFASEVKKKHKW